MNNIDIEELPAYEFTYDKWSAGSFSDLGMLNGHFDIDTQQGYRLIRKYAIGYCDGAKLYVRPKLDCVAILLFKDETTFWTHLTKEEFKKIFGENI